jgi:purine nucleoside phosphorylase
LINRKAIITALHSLGVTQIIAFGSVGTLKKTIPLGTLVVPDDFLAPAFPTSFFDYSARGHM